jgi:hypothetical protein
VFFLADVCQAAEAGVTNPFFSSIPRIFVEQTDGSDAGDCQKTGALKGQSSTILWVIPDDQTVTCDRSGSFEITIPQY